MVRARREATSNPLAKTLLDTLTQEQFNFSPVSVDIEEQEEEEEEVEEGVREEEAEYCDVGGGEQVHQVEEDEKNIW